jgi:hypothetical protein
MAFDVTPAPVRRRGPRIPVIVVLAAGIGVVAIAVLTSSPSSGPIVSPDASVEAVARVEAAQTARPPSPAAVSPARSEPPARLPRELGCHEVAPATCGVLARAGVAALPLGAPTIATVDVWASILCGDDLDCPRDRLAGSTPLGSVVVAFADGGPSAWVNVVRRSPRAVDGGGPGRPEAWIVGWRP